jgi:hypothetical protein
LVEIWQFYLISSKYDKLRSFKKVKNPLMMLKRNFFGKMAEICLIKKMLILTKIFLLVNFLLWKYNKSMAIGYKGFLLKKLAKAFRFS